MAILVREKPEPRSGIDTRQSIMRRLMTYGAERRRLEQRLAVIAELEKEFQEFLREVDQRDQPRLIPDEPPPPAAEMHNNAIIKDLLLRAIKAGPKTLEDLVRIAHQTGINFGEKAPARVIHFNLLNLKNAGLIDRDDDLWTIADKK